MVKNTAWSCVMKDDSEGVKKEDQTVNLILLRNLMLELKVSIDYYELKHK